MAPDTRPNVREEIANPIDHVAAIVAAHGTVRDPVRAHHELDKSVVGDHNVGVLPTALSLLGGLWEAVEFAQWAGGALAGEPWI